MIIASTYYWSVKLASLESFSYKITICPEIDETINLSVLAPLFHYNIYDMLLEEPLLHRAVWS